MLISIRYNMHRLAVHQYSLRLRDSRHSDWCHLVAGYWPLLTSSQIFIQFRIKKAKNNSIENWKCEKGTKMDQTVLIQISFKFIWGSKFGLSLTLHWRQHYNHDILQWQMSKRAKNPEQWQLCGNQDSSNIRIHHTHIQPILFRFDTWLELQVLKERISFNKVNPANNIVENWKRNSTPYHKFIISTNWYSQNDFSRSKTITPHKKLSWRKSNRTFKLTVPCIDWTNVQSYQYNDGSGNFLDFTFAFTLN